ncbi:hypothetical protein A7L08_18205 [Acinetobacter baumannii]|nr:hypothetical protein A7L08_18205 [Acinetobacter baumannii]
MSCWAARKGRFGAEDLPRPVYSEGARQVPDQQEVAVPSPDRDFNYIEPRIGGEFLVSRQVDVQPTGECFTKLVYNSFHVY